MTKDIIVLPPQEAEEYKGRVLEAQEAAERFAIVSMEDMESGADLLHMVKEVKKSVTDKKESITRPLMDTLSAVRDMFRPLEEGYALAEKTIKGKMVSFQESEEARVAAEKAKIEKRVEKGTMRADTAAAKFEDIQEVQKSVSGTFGKIQTRTVVKIKIVDESLIPREYMTPNLTALTEAILRKGLEVAGVQKVEEKQIAAR
jgi:hypothetical protein